KRDLVVIEEVPDLRTRRVEPLPDDYRARRRWVGGDPLEAAGTAHTVGRERAHPLDETRMRRGNGVIGTGVDSQHPGFLCGPEPDRKDCPERDRPLPEDRARLSLADDRLDSLGCLDRLDPAREQPEESLVAALQYRVLARQQCQVGRCPGELL